jgi:hypothetical protein
VMLRFNRSNFVYYVQGFFEINLGDYCLSDDAINLILKHSKGMDFDSDSPISRLLELCLRGDITKDELAIIYHQLNRSFIHDAVGEPSSNALKLAQFVHRVVPEDTVAAYYLMGAFELGGDVLTLVPDKIKMEKLSLQLQVVVEAMEAGDNDYAFAILLHYFESKIDALCYPDFDRAALQQIHDGCVTTAG